MKKALLVFFVLGISMLSFAGLKEKDVLGSWSYSIVTNEGTLAGTLKFTKEKDELAGKAITDRGDTFILRNIEIRDDNVLYFEVQPDYEVLKIKITFDGKVYSGTIGNSEGELPITGEKTE